MFFNFVRIKTDIFIDKMKAFYFTSIFFGLILSSLFSQDLWVNSGEIFTRSTPTILPIGSIIHVEYRHSLQLEYRSTLRHLFQKNKRHSQLETDLFSFLPNRSINKDETAQIDNEFSLNRDFEGVLSGAITGYNSVSDVYTIEIRHSVQTESNPLIFMMRAAVNGKDFIGKSVSSQKLANVRMIFSQKNTPTRTFTEKDFLNFFEDPLEKEGIRPSTSETTPSKGEEKSDPPKKTQLNLEAKRRLFLEWFNFLLDELF